MRACVGVCLCVMMGVVRGKGEPEVTMSARRWPWQMRVLGAITTILRGDSNVGRSCWIIPRRCVAWQDLHQEPRTIAAERAGADSTQVAAESYMFTCYHRERVNSRASRHNVLRHAYDS